MKIKNSLKNDIDEIFRLYKIATDFQKTKDSAVWPTFEYQLIEKEILEKHQWKISIDNQIACVWATTFNDPNIWEALDVDQAIYIHRIATNPIFRGQKLVEEIINWSKEFAKSNNKKFIRMDTVGNNLGLISYYKKMGFDYLGLHKLANTSKLPAHYENASVSLFQISL